jgi:host factor-I protein
MLLRYNTFMPPRVANPSVSKKPSKTPPPEDTGMEASYLKSLGENQTPVTIKLASGESFSGWIEYYDAAMVRLTREDGPNLFIFKHEIMSITEEHAQKPRP